MRLKIDHDAVMNMWADGVPTDEIMAKAGTIYRPSILGIVSDHRRNGDPRAKRRDRNSSQTSAKAQLAASLARARRRRRLQRFPATVADLDRAIAEYRGPVMTLGTGYHAGHVPACLKALNY